jgi:hypothetical protein
MSFSCARLFSLCLAFFKTLAHGLAYDTICHLHLSVFSARAGSWPRTSKRCFASMTTLASQSRASPRMHACSGPSYRFLSYERGWRLRHEPFSVYVQQLYAPAGHGVQDGLQSARPRKSSRVRHRRQCVIFFSLSMCLLPGGRRGVHLPSADAQISLQRHR